MAEAAQESSMGSPHPRKYTRRAKDFLGRQVLKTEADSYDEAFEAKQTEIMHKPCLGKCGYGATKDCQNRIRLSDAQHDARGLKICAHFPVERSGNMAHLGVSYACIVLSFVS